MGQRATRQGRQQADIGGQWDRWGKDRASGQQTRVAVPSVNSEGHAKGETARTHRHTQKRVRCQTAASGLHEHLTPHASQRPQWMTPCALHPTELDWSGWIPPLGQSCPSTAWPLRLQPHHSFQCHPLPSAHGTATPSYCCTVGPCQSSPPCGAKTYQEARVGMDTQGHPGQRPVLSLVPSPLPHKPPYPGPVHCAKQCHRSSGHPAQSLHRSHVTALLPSGTPQH